MSSAARLRAATVGVSLASLPFAMPHVLEDFARGTACLGWLAPEACAAGLGAFLALQALGLVALAAGRRAGWALTMAVGLVWLAGAALEHGPAVVGGTVGRSALSGVWLGGLVGGQAVAVLLAAWGWRATAA